MRRVEDRRFLTGLGRYTDDLPVPGRCMRCLCARPMQPRGCAHAVDISAVLAVPGVRAVFRGEDLRGLGTLRCLVPRALPDGRPMPQPPYHALALEAVRHVGDPVAMVVADSAPRRWTVPKRWWWTMILCRR